MTSRRLSFAIGLIVFQALAALFFIADAVVDAGMGGESRTISLFEVGMAFALLAGIALGAELVRRLFAEARAREQVLALAQGAVADVVEQRFVQWRLSRSEADVGLFALKGCSIAEIARLRGSAEGTVRAQLSQVYAKAGVSSQPAFVALFLEELLD